MTLLGIWPEGPDHETLLRVETLMGTKAGMYRERGSRGGLNQPLYKPGFVQELGNRIASMEINCRLDNQANYIPYTRVLLGEFDAELRQRAREFTALAGIHPGPHLIELQSEADLYPKHDSGSAAEARQFQAYVHRVFLAEGVNPDTILWGVSLLQGTYRNTAEAASWINLGVVQVALCDGYDHRTTYPTKLPKSFESMVSACRSWASDHSLAWAVTEVGAEEDSTAAGYKAGWYAAELAYLKRVKDCYAVVHNYSADGPSGSRAPWYFDTSTRSKDAFVTLANDPIFTSQGGTVDPCAQVKSDLTAAQATIGDLQGALTLATNQRDAAKATLNATTAERDTAQAKLNAIKVCLQSGTPRKQVACIKGVLG